MLLAVAATTASGVMSAEIGDAVAHTGGDVAPALAANWP